MDGIYISDSKDYFVRDGEKFFYLADTAWSAFTNASLDDWRYYLEIRRAQEFNAIQINILPQWDRSESDLYIEPFEVTSSSGWDFTKVNEVYFDRVEKMVEMAVENGFTPALVVLWCNYVKGTWGSKLTPSKIIPFEYLQSYVEYVVDRFAKYSPIFVISGDPNFETDEAVKYYLAALEVVKKRAPQCLTTMHLARGVVIPEPFVYSPYLDFYMYQSGHRRDEQFLAYELAQKFYRLPVKRPIVNGEPCYEGMGYAVGRLGRFTRLDVRKAVWQSLLSGAKAGTAYGALGIWNWHVLGKRFLKENSWGLSYDWRTALTFPGAYDVAFAKWLFENYDLFDIEPANDKLIKKDKDPRELEEIRISIGKGKIIFYTPYYNYTIKLDIDGSSYRWKGIELESRRVFKPRIETEKGYTSINLPEFINSDSIVIGIEK
uniref:DUF4038 domain-containing protein n=1 Tax=Ignisphaera aggregans TaxID=334771 RepID=A0A7J3QDJ5_9CREN